MGMHCWHAIEQGVQGCHEVLCFPNDKPLAGQQCLKSSTMHLCGGWVHLSS